MKVICKKVFLTNETTVGKEYEVVQYNLPDFWTFIGDSGVQCHGLKEYFSEATPAIHSDPANGGKYADLQMQMEHRGPYSDPAGGEKSFGRVLSDLRYNSRLTLRQVEEATSISNAYLSQLENDKIKHPSANVLYKLATFYKVELDILLVACGLVSKNDIQLNQQLTEPEEEQLLRYLEWLRSNKKQYEPPSQQDRSVSQPGGEAMWDLLTEFYQLYINSENLGIEWDAFAEKVGSLVITDKESEAPEGYHWSVPSGKYHDDEPVLRKNRIENTPQPSQPGGGWSDTQLKDFGEYCDNHEGSMENLFKQWKNKQI